jgi:NAD(P)H dehydrogenase (quinone)
MTTATHEKDTLLVTGASGQLGRRVLAHLLDTCRVPAPRIIAVTRTPAKLADLSERGVDVRRGDFEEPETLAAAFRGADRLLLISTDTLDRPGARLAQHLAAVAAAKAAGVGHVFYTSMPNPAGSPILFAPDHLQTEEALARSGLRRTILRNAWYFENLAFSLPVILATGKWFTASGEGRVANLSRDDCARVAAMALVNPAPAPLYDVTGSEALTTAEIAAIVGDSFGKPIEVVHVSDDQLVGGMVAGGLPEPVARIWASFDTATRLGNFSNVSDTVEVLTGRRAQTLRDFLAESRDALLPAAAE